MSEEKVKKPLMPMGDRAFFDKKTGTVVELHYENRSQAMLEDGYDIGKITTVLGLDKKIKYWGADNRLPQYRDALLMSSNIVGELVSAKRDLLIGQGLVAYKEEYNEKGEKLRKYVPTPPDVAEWIRKSRWVKRYLQNGVLNYFKQANVFVEFMKAKDGKLLYMKSHDSKHVRPCEKVKGVIPGYYICADWDLKFDEKENPITYIPAMPEYTDAKELPNHFMMHFGDEVFHDGYLYHPAYWGGEEWIDLANNIPVWHKANIKNGYTPRFHIKIPRDYFLDKAAAKSAQTAEDAKKCTDAAAAAQQDFIDKMNKFLAGEDNAGRAVYTIEDFNVMLKEYQGIEIVEIKYDMKDEAMLKLFEASNQANISAQGFPPILAGIENQGKLSSGSEIRNILMYFIISKLPRRRADILSPFDVMLDINGWYDPEIKYTFEDVLITKLDENKTGTDKPKDEEDTTNDNESVKSKVMLSDADYISKLEYLQDKDPLNEMLAKLRKGNSALNAVYLMQEIRNIPERVPKAKPVDTKKAQSAATELEIELRHLRQSRDELSNNFQMCTTDQERARVSVRIGELTGRMMGIIGRLDTYQESKEIEELPKSDKYPVPENDLELYKLRKNLTDYVSKGKKMIDQLFARKNAAKNKADAARMDEKIRDKEQAVREWNIHKKFVENEINRRKNT